MPPPIDPTAPPYPERLMVPPEMSLPTLPQDAKIGSNRDDLAPTWICPPKVAPLIWMAPSPLRKMPPPIGYPGSAYFVIIYSLIYDLQLSCIEVSYANAL